MNSVIEVVVVAAVVAAALAFIVVRAVKAFRSKRPSCCSGGADCPHCRERARRDRPVLCHVKNEP